MSSIPDCSIDGIKPIIEPIPSDIIEQETQKRSKFLITNGSYKRCCVCGNVPTKMVTYPIQGAVRIERYCDTCVERQFSRNQDQKVETNEGNLHS